MPETTRSAGLEQGARLPPFRFVGPPLGHDPEMNIIHTDETARTYGFRAALVGGVTTFGYMVRDGLRALGEGWFEDGYASVRWVRPVYTGEELSAFTEVASASDGRTELALWVEDDGGGTRATGTLALPRDARAQGPGPFRFHSERRPALAAGERPNLEPGNEHLGEPMRPVVLTTAQDGTPARFERAFPDLVQPDWLAASGIRLIRQNFNRPTPNVHVSAAIWTYRPARVGDVLTVYGGFTKAYEKRGNLLIDEDVEIRNELDEPVARVLNTFIYQLRQA
jgi:acyl dehydratase